MAKAKKAVKNKEVGIDEDELEALLNMDLEAESKAEIVAAEIEADTLADLEASLEESVEETIELPEETPEVATVEVSSKTKRISTAGMKPSAVIEAKIGEEFDDLAVRTESEGNLKGAKKKAHIEDFKAQIDALPKKVGEKAINVFQHLNAGTDLSVYTQDAIIYLKQHGSMTVSELKAHYAAPACGVRNKGYSSGTAGAQSSQMKALLPALGIAVCDGTKLTLSGDSVLADMLCPM